MKPRTRFALVMLVIVSLFGVAAQTAVMAATMPFMAHGSMDDVVDVDVAAKAPSSADHQAHDAASMMIDEPPLHSSPGTAIECPFSALCAVSTCNLPTMLQRVAATTALRPALLPATALAAADMSVVLVLELPPPRR